MSVNQDNNLSNMFNDLYVNKLHYGNLYPPIDIIGITGPTGPQGSGSNLTPLYSNGSQIYINRDVATPNGILSINTGSAIGPVYKSIDILTDGGIYPNAGSCFRLIPGSNGDVNFFAGYTDFGYTGGQPDLNTYGKYNFYNIGSSKSLTIDTYSQKLELQQGLVFNNSLVLSNPSLPSTTLGCYLENNFYLDFSGCFSPAIVVSAQCIRTQNKVDLFINSFTGIADVSSAMLVSGLPSYILPSSTSSLNNWYVPLVDNSSYVISLCELTYISGNWYLKFSSSQQPNQIFTGTCGIPKIIHLSWFLNLF